MLGDISYHKATLRSEGKHSIHSFVSVGNFSSYSKNKWKVLKIGLFACHEILAFKNYLLLAGLKCVTYRLNQFKAEMPQFTWIIILWHDCLIFKNPSVIPGIKLFQNDQHRYHYNTSNLLTTVSKGSGLHLLLGRDEVLWTFAVGFLQRKDSIDLFNRFIASTNKHFPFATIYVVVQFYLLYNLFLNQYKIFWTSTNFLNHYKIFWTGTKYFHLHDCTLYKTRGADHFVLLIPSTSLANSKKGMKWCKYFFCLTSKHIW